jgi:hypothetical protein
LACTFAPLASSIVHAGPPVPSDSVPGSASAQFTDVAPGEHPPELRTWMSFGPYRPPADPDHWTDPRGTGIVVLGAGINTASAPTMTLGLEGVAWFASYASPPGALVLGGSDARMHGEFYGLGPVAKARFAFGRWEPAASATLLLVSSHLEWPSGFVGVPGAVEVESGWKGTFALGAGLGVRLWKGGGLGVRYDYIPLLASFGALSNGSADVGVNSVLLSVYHDMRMPSWRGLGGPAGRGR